MPLGALELMVEVVLTSPSNIQKWVAPFSTLSLSFPLVFVH